MKRHEVTVLGAVLMLALGGMSGLVAADSDREDSEAVALLAEIVELRQARVDALGRQRHLMPNPDVESYLDMAGALEELCHARVRLAREQSRDDDERQAVEESLVALRKVYADAEGNRYQIDPATLGMLRVSILEAELRLLRLGE